jgi:hypothetical protein
LRQEVVPDSHESPKANSGSLTDPRGVSSEQW